MDYIAHKDFFDDDKQKHQILSLAVLDRDQMHTRGSDVKHTKRNIMPYAVRIASSWHAPNVIILVAKHSKVKLNLYSMFRGNIIIDYHTTQYSLKLCCVLYIYFTLLAYLL